MQNTGNGSGLRTTGGGLVWIVLYFFICAPITYGEYNGSAVDAYTAKGEIELYTGIVFPDSACNYYCHVQDSNPLTVIARFDIPREDMMSFSKHNPKIPILDNSSIRSDLMVSSTIEPYRDRAWFANMIESDFLLFGKCAAKDQMQRWTSKVFASFVNNQILRLYLLYQDPQTIPHSTVMFYYTGLGIPSSAAHYQLIRKHVGLYENTLNTSVRFDLPLQEGYEFIDAVKSQLHFTKENPRRIMENTAVQRLVKKLTREPPVLGPSNETFVGKPASSLRFDAIIAAAFVKNATMTFYLDYYERIGLQNKTEELGEFLGLPLSSNVTNIQYHLMWYGAGKMIRFDLPKTELNNILDQLATDTTLSTLEKGDTLKDRILENHGVAWWTPNQMQDTKWCIKNNGTLFVAAGIFEEQECATVFAKYIDAGF